MSKKNDHEIASLLATEILKQMHDVALDTNIAQSALGSAWYRLCMGMKIPPADFKNMLTDMLELYHSDYHSTYPS